MNLFNKNRRKVFLINPKFQWSFLRHCFGLAFAVIAVVYTANTFFFWGLRSKGIALGLEPNHVFFRFVEQQRQSMNWIFLACSAVVALSITVFGLRLSHRIAGPFFNLTRNLKKIRSSGIRKPLTFRDSDYFPEVAEAVNEFIDSGAKNHETKKISKAG